MIAAKAGRALACGLLMALGCAPAWANDATRPIRLIVPTPPGSASDALARAMSIPWSKASGRAIVVENIVGAGTTIGSRRIAQAVPDGLTLGLISSNHTLNPWLYKDLPYDALADFTPIAMIGTVPAILVANPRVAASTPTELAALSQSAAAPLAEGIVSGTIYHLAGEVFKQQAGVRTNPIPYKGSAQVVNDLLGGTLDIGLVAVQSGAPQVSAGKLKGIAVTAAKRSAMAPQVPTLRESGLPDFDVEAWLAIVAPAGLSERDLAARRRELVQVLADGDLQRAMRNQGIQVMDMAPADIPAFLKAELERNRSLVQRMGVAVD